jgi:hypothetical protein
MNKDYGMYTNEGNFEVEKVVVEAKNLGLAWDEVVALLQALSNTKGFEEAMDTVVREEVNAELFI